MAATRDPFDNHIGATPWHAAGWLGAYIAGGVLGVGAGVLQFALVLRMLDYLLPLEDCSGIPCGPWAWGSILVSATLGGATGGVIGYGVTQSLLRRRINSRTLMLSGLAGSQSWPAVIVLGAMAFGVFCALSLDELLRFPSPNSPEFAGYRLALQVLTLVIVPGSVIGCVVAFVRWSVAALLGRLGAGREGPAP